MSYLWVNDVKYTINKKPLIYALAFLNSLCYINYHIVVTMHACMYLYNIFSVHSIYLRRTLHCRKKGGMPTCHAGGNDDLSKLWYSYINLESVFISTCHSNSHHLEGSPQACHIRRWLEPT